MRAKTYAGSYSPLSQNVPRNGHCLRAKLNLNETKKKKKGKKKGGDVAVAAWQNPPLRGGRRSALAATQREGSMSGRGYVIAHR